MTRPVRLIAAAIALLVLAACGSNNNTLPDPTITSVNPESITAGENISITGANYYGIDGHASTRIEVCGVTTTASIVEPVTRTILLPPGSKITAQVGTELTANVPDEGFTPGTSSVRVIRPDGASVTLENAITCVAPEPEEPEEPGAPAAPVITSFTAPATVELGEAVTFTWGITNEDDSLLTCTINPGDESAPVTLDDCAGSFTHTYPAAGTFTAELTVTDEHDQSDTAKHTATVTEPEPALPTAPVITGFTGPNNELLGNPAAFSWVISNPDNSDLTCTFNPGDETATITLDNCDSPMNHTYSATGTFTTTLTVTDQHGQSTSAQHDITISLRPTPVITTFTAEETAFTGDTITFTWSIDYTGDDQLTCTINPGDGTTSQAVTCTAEELQLEYATAGDHTAVFTVTDEHSQEDSRSHEVSVTQRPAPRITRFTAPETAIVGEAITFTWIVDYDGPDELTCTINSGDTSGAQAVACDLGELELTYSAAGSYPVEFKVADEHGQEATSGRLLTVTPAPPPPAPVITNFTALELAVIEEPVTFTWAIDYTGTDSLTCTFSPGNTSGGQTVDCALGEFEQTYDTAGDYTAVLTIEDQRNQADTAEHQITVTLPEQPEIELFAPETVFAGEEFDIEWTVTAGSPLVVDCGLFMADSFDFVDMGDNSCTHGTVTLSNSGNGPADIEYHVEDKFGRLITARVTVTAIPRPTTIQMSVTPGHLEAETVINGPNGFSEIMTITDGDVLTLPEPGEYTLTPAAHVAEDIRILDSDGNEISGTRDWDLLGASTITVNAAAGGTHSIDLEYAQRTEAFSVEIFNTSGSLDLNWLNYEIEVYRHSDETVGEWTYDLTITRPGDFSLRPGHYRLVARDINHNVASGGSTRLETYAPTSGGESHLTLNSVMGGNATLGFDYELVPGELTVNFIDLPAGAPGEVTLLALDAGGTNNPPLDQIPPGTYIIRGATYETNEAFNDQNGNPQYLYTRYETDFEVVTISSGTNPQQTFQYALEDGTIRLGILAATHLPADTEIIGNVTFTHLQSDQTFTLTEQTPENTTANLRHYLKAPPGVYRIEIQPVAPSPDEHDGFQPYPEPQVLYRTLASTAPLHTGNDMTIDVRYTPNPTP